MNREQALKIADAVLYEGYMLYPYRPSALKNRQRWSFGILYPPDYVEVRQGTERSQMHSECLLKMNTKPRVRVQLRFLHLLAQEVLDEQGRPVASIVVDGRVTEGWDKGVERSLEFEFAPAAGETERFSFGFPATTQVEALLNAAGSTAGALRQQQAAMAGAVTISAAELSHDVIKLTVDVTNTGSVAGDPNDRDSALHCSLLSAHTILSASGAEFLSLLDPPDDLREAVGDCKNVGNFPVLLGEQGERDMMLCSPITLYDYPQIAPESAGDFYDATEMDEMLTLRVMTLTDEEKNEIRQAGDHVSSLLQRTEQSARRQLMRTHGTIRGMRPVNE